MSQEVMIWFGIDFEVFLHLMIQLVLKFVENGNDLFLKIWKNSHPRTTYFPYFSQLSLFKLHISSPQRPNIILLECFLRKNLIFVLNILLRMSKFNYKNYEGRYFAFLCFRPSGPNQITMFSAYLMKKIEKIKWAKNAFSYMLFCKHHLYKHRQPQIRLKIMHNLLKFEIFIRIQEESNDWDWSLLLQNLQI